MANISSVASLPSDGFSQVDGCLGYSSLTMELEEIIT